ncbi:DL-methionine ABC transporter MetINQ, permease protein [Campylobacter subantarcticus LMG 24377]|uniref:DL-methionine ABC transporter MetINQ, permease protein n=2 Tax=Campylobacter subantarcticus TaxID=497724 RepID=A0A0A8HCC7_9BACT|nr:DL-methionine ABC transporter MetINQ, permease protein [Campylobacter subantarcticus LMG 24374]AJC92294.1 DL-methionine ABC transporter MetINQ, permease protein [Campylobacter subantarcticus LMG 24377]EAJ1260606.1 ABC transporter permease [Campylobacter lari]MPB99648.1 ABC transporter permease [Campylobacter subantarcticus]QOR01803.1 ABC transporter permease [Campylobacter sp. 2014D-0216]
MNIEAIIRNFENILYPALLETLYMSFTATFLAFLIALIPAIVLTVTDKGGLCENKGIYSVLDFIINILRSFPFLVLIVVLSPFTKYLIGISIGTTATIVPLTIGIAPYLAKMIESAFKEIDPGIIEAARSYGASKTQIIFKVMFSEALPSIINGITLILIIVIGFSAMAGTVGGGGLGDVAIRYGYERFRTDIMIQTVVILIVLVQIIQFIGNMLYKITKR